jgi:hypothetical protein
MYLLGRQYLYFCISKYNSIGTFVPVNLSKLWCHPSVQVTTPNFYWLCQYLYCCVRKTSTMCTCGSTPNFCCLCQYLYCCARKTSKLRTCGSISSCSGKKYDTSSTVFSHSPCLTKLCYMYIPTHTHIPTHIYTYFHPTCLTSTVLGMYVHIYTHKHISIPHVWCYLCYM